MNTNSNVYTVIYSTVLVVVVAAILAFAAEGLPDTAVGTEFTLVLCLTVGAAPLLR